MRCTRHLCRFVPELREYSVVVGRPRASAGCRGVRSRGAVTVGGRAVRNTGVGAPLSLLPVFRVVRCPGCRGAVVCVRRREAASGSCRLCFAAVGRSGARGHRLLAAAAGSFRLCFVSSVVPGRGVVVCVRQRDGRFGALLRAGLPWLRLPETLRVAVGFGRLCRVCPSSGMLDDDRVTPSDRRTCRVMRHRSRMRQSVRRWRRTAERIACGPVPIRGNRCRSVRVPHPLRGAAPRRRPYSSPAASLATMRTPTASMPCAGRTGAIVSR